MTPAQRIRKAALGPPLSASQSVGRWVGFGDEWRAVYDALPYGMLNWLDMTDTERRLFLLFVAEALENE